MNPGACKTIPRMFEDSVARHAANVLLLERREDAYRGSTYREIREHVHQCAAGLMSLGIRKGERVALLSEGRNDWVVAELGILYAGAVNVPLSVKIEELSEIEFRLAHSGCRMAIVSGAQAQKLQAAAARLPQLELVIFLDGGEATQERGLAFRELLARGREHLVAQRQEFQDRWQSIEDTDPANICYTSGTTADPKGVVLTHGNYIANVEQAYRILEFPPSFTTLMILPWDHSFAHLVMYLLMRRGAGFAAVQQGKTPTETLKNIARNIREVRPNFLLSVPALAKNFRKNIEKGIRDKGERVERLFRLGLAAAYQYNRDGFTRGRGASLRLRLKVKLCDFLIFRKIRAGFGGRLEYFIGGGALLDVELQRFFYAIGIPMYQGYGLTEAAPVISANVPARHKLGSSGTVMPDLEVRICNEQTRALPVGQQGEIVVRGENVMAGYWRNEKTTRETLRDGWLHTGDLGFLDEDGFLFVLGRQKSLLIGHDGEKFSPEGIEETIVGNSPYIDQIMLHNDQSQYTIALVVPNRQAVDAALKGRNLDRRSAQGRDAALVLLEGEIDAYRKGGKYAGLFPERWLPATIAVLEEGFTEQNRLLNSTLKMVRGRVAELYQERIAFLYTREGKSVRNPANRAAIEKLG